MVIGAFSTTSATRADNDHGVSVGLELLDNRVQFGSVCVTFDRVSVSGGGPLDMMLRKLSLNLNVDDIGWQLRGQARFKVCSAYIIIFAFAGQ